MALHCAAAAGDVPTVASLLLSAPSLATAVDAGGKLALHCAAAGSLLNLDVLPSAALGSLAATTPACGEGHADALALLLSALPQQGASARDARGNTALAYAVAAGNAAGTRLLLVAGGAASATTAGTEGRVALHYATALPPSEAAEAIVGMLLVAAPGAAAVQDSQGRTALHHAVACRNLLLVRHILAAAPWSALVADTAGALPLHQAAASLLPTAEVARLLLAAAPAAAWATDGQGATPLACAAAAGNAPLLDVLLAHDPDTAGMRNARHGRLPLETALDGLALGGYACGRFAQAARLLLAHGPADALLPALATAGKRAAPMFADLVARLPLAQEQWQQVPAACPGLGCALPAVLARSEAEAGCLVARLPAPERERLHSFALCLGRAAPQLPVPVAWMMLALYDS